MPIQIILEVEMTREPRPRILLLRPSPRVLLSRRIVVRCPRGWRSSHLVRNQSPRGLLCRSITDAPCSAGHQAHQSPRRLRSRRDAPPPGPLGKLVRVHALAPPSVCILHAPEPAEGRSHEPLRIGMVAVVRKTAERVARAVDVVDAPAAVPRAAGLLLGGQVAIAAAEASRVRLSKFGITNRLSAM